MIRIVDNPALEKLRGLCALQFRSIGVKETNIDSAVKKIIAHGHDRLHIAYEDSLTNEFYHLLGKYYLSRHLLCADSDKFQKAVSWYPDFLAHKPTTINENAEKLADLLNVDKDRVIEGAYRRLQILYQSPETIAARMALVREFNTRGLIEQSASDYVLDRRPRLLTYSEDNIRLRLQLAQKKRELNIPIGLEILREPKHSLEKQARELDLDLI